MCHSSILPPIFTAIFSPQKDVLVFAVHETLINIPDEFFSEKKPITNAQNEVAGRRSTDLKPFGGTVKLGYFARVSEGVRARVLVRG